MHPFLAAKAFESLTTAERDSLIQTSVNGSHINDFPHLKDALKALINLHYKEKLRAIQVHFSPAQLGDELTNDQLMQYYPELIPL